MAKLNLRSFVSLTLFISIVLVVYTGIILYIAPAGRIANWSDWTVLGLSKESYSNIHTTASFLFTFFSVWHCALNWKAIVCYLQKNKSKKTMFFTKEFIAALALTVFVLLGTHYHVPPVSVILDVGEGIKASWEDQEPLHDPLDMTSKVGGSGAGYGFYSIEQISNQEGIAVERAIERLQKAGVSATADTEIREIVRHHGLSMQEVVELMLGD
ncbi:DUF4405 domain-containing protein [Heliorestis acidaminivorans]|uniref:DUF4405 domain-containing protein n=1 Tax=Heliorestis acidaminivorans TaxID=553427 RepID=A0A6I0EY82_9FIRM|nr:DUF4405 domain-containing protein [Heliorestis acidaminivorans]KAB2951652.1 DUF4405 domain-containing protein [Heliorestis acidaminivorans]